MDLLVVSPDQTNIHIYLNCNSTSKIFSSHSVNKNPDEKFAPRTLHPFFMLSWTRKCREPSLLDHPQSQGSLFLIKPRFFLVHSRKITPPYRQLETMHRGGFFLFDYLCQRSSSWAIGAGGTKGTIVFLHPRFWINAPTFSDTPMALLSICRSGL